MAHTIHYLFLLLLSCICQQSYALFAASSTKGVSLAVTFPPRGGGLGFGRRNGPPPEEDTAIIDTDESEEDNTAFKIKSLSPNSVGATTEDLFLIQHVLS